MTSGSSSKSRSEQPLKYPVINSGHHEIRASTQLFLKVGFLGLALSLIFTGYNFAHVFVTSMYLTAAQNLSIENVETTNLDMFYSFKVNSITGRPFDLNQLKGKAVMVVNVASKCGFTNQYLGLQSLYEDYKDRGLEILGFPCNQFGGQEPGSLEEIASFCKSNFGVTFPMMEKVDVNGDNAHPLWEWMKNEKKQLMMSRVNWNFEKFMIDKQGNVVDRYASTAEPSSLKPAIEKLLLQ